MCDNAPTLTLLSSGNYPDLARYCPQEYAAYQQALARYREAIADRLELSAAGMSLRAALREGRVHTRSEAVAWVRHFDIRAWLEQAPEEERKTLLANLADPDRVREFVEGNARDVLRETPKRDPVANLDMWRRVALGYSFAHGVLKEQATLLRAAAEARERALAERIQRHPNFVMLLEWLRDNRRKTLWSGRVFGVTLAAALGAAAGGIVVATRRVLGSLFGTAAAVSAGSAARRWMWRREKRLAMEQSARFVEQVAESEWTLTHDALDLWQSAVKRAVRGEGRAQMVGALAAVAAGILAGGAVRAALENPELLGELGRAVRRAVEGVGGSLEEASRHALELAPHGGPEAGGPAGGDVPEAPAVSEVLTAPESAPLPQSLPPESTPRPTPAPSGEAFTPASPQELEGATQPSAPGSSAPNLPRFAEPPSTEQPAAAERPTTPSLAPPPAPAEGASGLTPSSPLGEVGPPYERVGQAPTIPSQGESVVGEAAEGSGNRPRLTQSDPATTGAFGLNNPTNAGNLPSSQIAALEERAGKVFADPAVELPEVSHASTLGELSPRIAEALARRVVEAAPSEVVVQKGDTLWGILTKVVGDAFPYCNKELINNIVAETIRAGEQGGARLWETLGVSSGDPNTIFAGERVKVQTMLRAMFDSRLGDAPWGEYGAGGGSGG